MKLPTDKVSLARVVQNHVERGSAHLMYRRTLWLLAWHYLQGCRRFDVLDPINATIQSHYLDEDGNLEYQSQEMLYRINEVVGRIQGMDLRPAVHTNGTSLADLRSRSVGQVLADTTIPVEHLNEVQEAWAWYYVCLGGCGLHVAVEDHPALGLTQQLEVVHPQEVMPFPSVGKDWTKTSGIMRVRMVPVDTLVDKLGSSIKNKMDNMEWYEVDPGEDWTDPTDDQTTLYHSSTGSSSVGWTGYSPGKKGIAKETIAVVRVAELWQTGVASTVKRFVMSSGDEILEDQDLGGTEAYCPLAYGRFLHQGSWWGLGMFELMFSTHRQLEKLLKSLFQNVMELDRYGVLVLPQGQFNQNQVLREVGKGLKAMFWEPDPTAEGFNPFSIAPANSGTLPGQVAEIAKGQMDQLTPIRNLIEEKGRVDSAVGLGFLEEQIQQAMTSPTKGVQRTWGSVYKAGIQQVAYAIVKSPRSLRVGQLTLDMAGVVVDPKTGEVEFPRNPLPTMNRLVCTVKDVSPRSPTAIKSEMMAMWTNQVETDPLAIKLYALKEGLDIALWTEEERGAYEQCIRDILTLYSDGIEPAQHLVLAPYMVHVDLMERLLVGFMVGPHMRAASVRVQSEFKNLLDTIRQWKGNVLPQGIPLPEDAALLASQGPFTPSLNNMGGMGGMGGVGGVPMLDGGGVGGMMGSVMGMPEVGT